MDKRKKVVVYGVGNFYTKNRNKVEEEFDVVAYVDKKMKSCNDNSKIVINNISEVNENFDYVLVMVENVSICFEIVRSILFEGISYDRIIIGKTLYGDLSDVCSIKVAQNGNFYVESKGIIISVKSEDELNNVIDTIVMECYEYNLNSSKQEIVFDVGMNVGDSAVYFGRMEKVQMVYAYEPFGDTYNRALENIKFNNLSNKIMPFNIGLSNRKFCQTVSFNANMSCGQSTILEYEKISKETYRNWGLIDESQNVDETVKINKASDEFRSIISGHKDKLFVLKMDCEGEEFAIIDDLDNGGLLGQFNLIMLEWHYKTPEMLKSIISKNGFSWCSINKSINPSMGLLFAWKHDCRE